MSFTFCDMFSGVGGMHLGCTPHGGECVLACEIDERARDIYQNNFGIIPETDIRKLDFFFKKEKLKIDLCTAGFPCQSYSALGKRGGLNDERGQLFFALFQFLVKMKPTSFLFENVKGLLTIERGKVLSEMEISLQHLGYTVSYFLLNSRDFDLPQNRERIYIVGNLNGIVFDPTDLEARRSKKITCLNHILESLQTLVPVKTMIFPCIDSSSSKNRYKENVTTTRTGFMLRAKRSNYTNRKLFSTNGIMGTLTTSSPPPIYDERLDMPRHLSKDELLRCQGFPINLFDKHVCSRSTVVKYIGNAVSVNVISAIVEEMRKQHLV
jgi:DNA (cytosine-5)-methyltransferase 1